MKPETKYRVVIHPALFRQMVALKRVADAQNGGPLRHELRQFERALRALSAGKETDFRGKRSDFPPSTMTCATARN